MQGKPPRADVVVEVKDDHRPRDMVVVEVQLERDAGKRFSWPHYITGVRARERCPVTLVVIAVDQGVARWCMNPIELDRAGSVVRAMVIGPDAIPRVTDPDYARRWPELAVLSAVAHGRDKGNEAIVLAALGASHTLDNTHGPLYADLILARLGAAARKALEKFMQQHGYTYQSDFAKKYVAQGVAQGVVQGYREMLCTQLQQRFGELSADDLARLDDAEADALRLWSERVLTARTLSEVFDGGTA